MLLIMMLLIMIDSSDAGRLCNLVFEARTCNRGHDTRTAAARQKAHKAGPTLVRVCVYGVVW